jgi:UDP-glucose 4-epimerase
MKLVLVTGGAGFIGSHLVEGLLARSYRVRVLDNLLQGSLDNLPENDALEFVEGDITDYKICQSVTRDVEGVFHLAAMSKVLPSLESPGMIDFCTLHNVTGTANVLKAALENRERVKKLIYSGSSTYYGARPVPTAEDLPHDCQTPYAVSKYVGELYCELFTRLHGLPTIRLRYFMTFGPRQPTSGPYAVVTGVFMNQWLAGKPLTILGDGLQTRDFIHVSDLIEGIIRAFESDVENSTINLGTGRALSIRGLAELISSMHDYLPPRIPDIRHQQADISRMVELLGWEPQIDVVDYYQSRIREHMLANPDHPNKPKWLFD